MNDKLKILELYNNVEPSKVSAFNNNLESNYSVTVNNENSSVDFEWLDLMEDSVRYIDNILRNPNRFIVNQEEIVKVEQARRITVETIKHLSKHTNFIQEIDENDEVKPSKILNINKDESYDTYENKLIYTLVQNMRSFLDIRKSKLVTTSYSKDTEASEYHGVTRIGSENINIDLVMNSKSNVTSNYKSNGNGTIEERIAKLDMRISDLMNTNVYKTLAKAHVARIIPPVKKTNLILKNVNFQYAMKLWDYLQAYTESGTSVQKEKVVYKDDTGTKNLFDNVFLLNYLISNNLRNKGNTLVEEDDKEIIKKLTNDMLDNIIQINSDLPVEEIEKYIGDKIALLKYKKEASLEEVIQKVNCRIQSLISKISNFKFDEEIK